MSLSLLLAGLLSAATSPVIANGPMQGVSMADVQWRVLERLDVSAASFQELTFPNTAIAADVDVNLDGVQHTLRLWPHDVRADDFQLIEADGTTEVVVPTPASVTLRGAVLGVDGGVVAGAIVDGQFEGLLRKGEFIYGIQPAQELGIGVHAVYRSDDLLELDAVCATPDEPTSITSFLHRTRIALGSLTFTAELAIDTDYEYYQASGSSTSNTQNDITNIINLVDGIYTAQLDLDHTITTIIVRTSSSDPYGTTDSSAFLGQFQNHWGNQQSGVVRDLAHLFTGKNLNGSTIGIAFPSAVCTGGGYALSQSRFSGNTNRRVALTAHEIAHNFSADHCNSQSSCRIMCSAVGACGSITSFASGPVSEIESFRNSRDCLDVSSPPILTGISPGELEVLDGDSLTVSGCHFSTLELITIGGVEYTAYNARVTILSDLLLQVVPESESQLGTVDVFLTGPGGNSSSLSVAVGLTDPPRLNLANDSFGAFPMTLDWGTQPGESYFLFYQLNDPSTFVFGGFELMSNAIYTGVAGICDAAGLGHFEVVIPPFALFQQTLFTQAVFFNAAFSGATPVESTYFNI